VTLQEQIRANRLRTVLVLFGFAVLVAALMAVIAGVYDPGLAGVLGIVAIVYGVISWFASGRIIAAAAGAHPVSKEEAPELYRAVENAAIGAGLTRTPAVYLIDDVAPNAGPQPGALLRRGDHGALEPARPP
jgi:heat shock protein HtpX